MNKQEIEALTLRIVDRVLNGKKVEDSLIECKGDWPQSTKARQLAGHANRARGEEILWIIGLDEKAAKLTSPESPDLAEWWAQMSRRFDDNVAPEMRDLRVQVDAENSVTALVFSTDRVPYVVKVSDAEGRVEREIPIRDGTRTRSAYRHEIIRMLQPAATPPMTALIYCELSAGAVRAENRIGIDFALRSHLYVEQRMIDSVMIPHHLISCRILPMGGDSDGEAQQIKLESTFISSRDENPNFGAHSRPDGIRVIGGAVLEFYSRKFLAGEQYLTYTDIPSFGVEISLEVAGASRPIIVKEIIRFSGRPQTSGSVHTLSARWSLPESAY